MISFIIPCYNCEKTICRCIDSIINQKLNSYEIIIIDDGSSDNTKKIIDEKYINIKEIKYYYKENEGQGIARNYGIQKALGEYITFIDSDDFYYKKSLKRIEENLNDEFDIIIFGLKKSENIKKDFKKNDKNVYIFYGNQINILEGILIAKGDFNWIDASCCNKIYKKDIIKENNIFFKSEKKVFSEDSLFNLEYYAFVKKGKVLSITAYCYYLNNESFTHTYHENSLEKIAKMILEYKDVVDKYYYEHIDKLKEIIEFKLFACIKYCIYCDYNYNNGKKIKKMVNYYKEKSSTYNKTKYFSKFEKIFLILLDFKAIFLIKLFCFLKKRKDMHGLNK